MLRRVPLPLVVALALVACSQAHDPLSLDAGRPDTTCEELLAAPDGAPCVGDATCFRDCCGAPNARCVDGRVSRWGECIDPFHCRCEGPIAERLTIRRADCGEVCTEELLLVIGVVLDVGGCIEDLVYTTRDAEGVTIEEHATPMSAETARELFDIVSTLDLDALEASYGCVDCPGVDVATLTMVSAERGATEHRYDAASPPPELAALHALLRRFSEVLAECEVGRPCDL